MNIKYMVHTCPNRLWYVEEFMIPSMLKQGIAKDEIYVYNDDLEDGNLLSSIKSFNLCSERFGEEIIWHLQDDVVICSDFRIRAEMMREKMHRANIIVTAGITVLDDGLEKQGEVFPKDLWLSFPCICINSRILRKYKSWVNEIKKTSALVQDAIRTKKNDDGVFRMYLKHCYSYAKCYNMVPNLVDHIDWLLGGSEVNKERKGIYRAKYFEDQYLVDELKEQLKSRMDTL